MARRTYTDEQREAALDQLAANRGNAHATARQTGIARSTIIRWAHELDAVTAGVALARSDPARASSLLDRWERLQHKTIDSAEAALDDTEHPPRLHDLAAIGRVAHDAFFDHKYGRKGMQVNVAVDARRIELAAMTDEELNALAEGAGLPPLDAERREAKALGEEALASHADIPEIAS